MIFAVIHEVVVYLVFIIPGFFIVPVAIAFRRVIESPIRTGQPIVTAPRWLWIWGNDEDGYTPWWYEVSTPTWNKYVRMWVWAAWRNPANNLRFIRAIYRPPVLGEVQIKNFDNGWAMLWQGWRTRLISPGWKLTVGFKYQPEDIVFRCSDWRMFGCGFGVRYVR